MNRSRAKQLAVWKLILIDFAAIGLCFYVFNLFHHIIPVEGGGPIGQTASIASALADELPDSSLEDVFRLADALSGNALPTDAPSGDEQSVGTPQPTASIRQVGDFSDTFPSEGPANPAAAYRFYRDDNVQVIIEKGQKGKYFVYYAAEIWVRDISFLKSGFAKNKYGRGIHETVSTMAKKYKALLAISGDYYGARSNGAVIRNGYLYRDTQLRDVCVLYENGELKSYERENLDWDAVLAKNPYQAWSFGPPLVRNGEILEIGDHPVAKTNPRCAIGYYEPGHYVFVIVDGRQEGYSEGATLEQLARLMSELGCVEAYNLDGGQSAEMIFQNTTVSHPVKGGRAISDIIYIGG